jgi:regulator of replication initiation timing
MRKNTMASLLLAVALGLPLIACEDTKAREENEQLKAHVAELVKNNGDLGNRVDALTQENTALKQENERLKAKKAQTKSSKTKHHRHTTKRAATSPN